jgi:hypothetical protein
VLAEAWLECIAEKSKGNAAPHAPLSNGGKMDAILEEVWTEFAAIRDVIPPIPPEVWNAFGAIAAGDLLILVVYILNLWGK